ncbi:MAG TPA: tetratricopeptide repeat protein, partial [Ktedonobacteraceae bacterium]|nr:tetratricopeptide repeat protein [Ktedonobacteraceae bacterium]
MCCCQQEQEAGPSLASASLAYKTAEYLRERGRYEEAKPLYLQALTQREQLLDVTHPEIARTLSPLAILSLTLGHYEHAQACYQRALQIYEQHPLEAHQREIARLLTNLGTLSLTLGKYAQAEGFYQRALALQEQ